MDDSQVALITGASRGIGRACAEALAAKRVRVFLAAEGTPVELDSAVAECRTAGAPEAACGVFDLAEPGAAEQMVAAAFARMGRIDVLVNNAGIRCRKPFGAFTGEDFERMFAVNVGAAFFASQAVLPIMRAQNGGRIINMASQMGSVAAVGNGLYGPTKAALIHLTRVMALELAADNIQVNAVSPGPVATQFLTDRYAGDPEGRAAMERMVPTGRFGKPEEIAEIVAFLATMQGRFVQGADFVVDGGYIIH